ncbi:MAG: MBL fold metallo-hydrolase [Arenimonas sp.]|uniref:MBL fold metallo-hydrolase n=1 Tax=Arenimonas sp. TaxID=1872635 RepID=UPI0025C6A07D|nr:MBL fold metallo-hydrolase [Arenimonas sp.]MBW8366670.1 MBL fold metallo-hydrolase [Arenimonas sp.]
MPRTLPATAAFAALLSALPVAAQDFSNVTVESTRVAEGVYTLKGAGGNVGLVVGDDRAFLIDDQYAPMVPKLRDAIARITDKPVSFVLNTHWHGDHTGGNEAFAQAGAMLVAHDNVRLRLSSDQVMAAFDRTVPAAPTGALPVVTFNDQITFHVGGLTVQAIHVPSAHTDGDAIVHLKEVDVIHTGDLVFYGLYPVVDYSNGGSLKGMADATAKLVAMSNDKTRFIPGHGPVVIGRAEIAEYLEMLRVVHARLEKLIGEGKTLEQVLAAKPTAEFDAQWGKGFLPPDRWVTINYQGMATAPDTAR